MTQQEIADEVGIPAAAQSLKSWAKIPKLEKIRKDSERQNRRACDSRRRGAETGEMRCRKTARARTPDTDEEPADEKSDIPQLEPKSLSQKRNWTRRREARP